MATEIARFFQPFPSSYGLDETAEKNVPKIIASQNFASLMRNKVRSFSPAACTWAKTLLGLQTCELFTFSEQGVRCSRL